jgi:molybdate transport system substrate-binding protein
MGTARTSVALALCVGLLLTACGKSGSAPVGHRQVRVAAAADLSAALAELSTAFTAKRGIDVSMSFGSSGTFYTQLLNRAPFDMFFSADLEYPRQLKERRLTIADSEFLYGVGRLVVWVPNGSALDIARDGLQALTDARVNHIAIANPEHAPYGRAAVAAMQGAGVYDRVKAKIVQGENVAQALQFVQSGAADAGVVALSLALSPNAKDRGRWLEIPLALYPRMEQGGTILRWSTDVEAAQAFRGFVLGEDGRAILKRYGFFLPER